MGKLILGFVLAGLVVGGIAIGYFFVFRSPYEPRPELALDNQFGFLTHAGPTRVQFSFIKEVGASWARPHPGPFVWGDMQRSAGGEIDFDVADKVVTEAQNYDVSLLVTLWPFAEWDQSGLGESCIVDDEFVRELGSYRCAPAELEAGREWVQAVVERYDGDGFDDMPGLVKPVKYWEVLNEPDLSHEVPGTQRKVGGLTFFVGSVDDFGDMFVALSDGIRSADAEANVLMAGAAGGDERFLRYYEELFSRTDVVEAFDIANVHCISSGDVGSLNVRPYIDLLDSLAIDVPVWVTEAEAFVSDDPQVNASQLADSSRVAIEAGADRIFFTGMNFEAPPGGDGSPMYVGGSAEARDEFDDAASDPNRVYQELISELR